MKPATHYSYIVAWGLFAFAGCLDPGVVGDGRLQGEDAESFVQWKASAQGWAMVRCDVGRLLPEGRIAVLHGPPKRESFALVTEGVALLPVPPGVGEALVYAAPDVAGTLRWEGAVAAGWTDCRWFHPANARVLGRVVEADGSPFVPGDPDVLTVVGGCGLWTSPAADGTFSLWRPPARCALAVHRHHGASSATGPAVVVHFTDAPALPTLLRAPPTPARSTMPPHATKRVAWAAFEEWLRRRLSFP